MKWMMTLIGALVLAASPVLAFEWGQYGMASLRIAVQDEARSIAFYRLLGMEVGRLHHPGQQEMNWEKASQGPGIVLVSDPALLERGDIRLVPGTANFLITVPDTHAVAEALRDAGFSVAGEPRQTPHYVGLTVRDPDGNLINLMGPLPE